MLYWSTLLMVITVLVLMFVGFLPGNNGLVFFVAGIFIIFWAFQRALLKGKTDSIFHEKEERVEKIKKMYKKNRRR
ncbi:MAG: hypothetical protein M0R46_08315 [Candidatus Muirbacterium halophilum]|nr:hypothetical protein [Candidatus Muirbacterium halophilum]MCK9475907.1 hypothetical protein [Candidatus Muirbacterium halophilum]